MATTVTGSGVDPGIARGGAPSIARGAVVSLIVLGDTFTTAGTVAFGSSSSPPATFGGMHGATGQPWDQFKNVSSQFLGMSNIRATLADTIDCSGMTLGEHLFFACFNTNPVSGSDVPVATFDCGVLVA